MLSSGRFRERFSELPRLHYLDFTLGDILNVEKIENYPLSQLFKLNRKRVPGQPKLLYQRVRAQFCELICRVGFQTEYAPPEVQKYGDGIYFTTEVGKALKLWDDGGDEEFVYIIVAQVLTGNDSEFLPSEPVVRHGCLTNFQRDIYVVFNGQQALPEAIVTCKEKKKDIL